MAFPLLPRFFRPSGLSSPFQADFSSLPFDSAYLASLFVFFRPSLLRSHSCSTGACRLSASFPLLLSGLRPSGLLLPFVRFRSFRSGYSTFSLFRSAASLTHLAPVSFGALRFFRRFGFHGFLRLVSHPLSSVSAYLVLCLVSFHPSQLRSRSCSVGACLVFRFVSSASPSGIRPLLPFPFGPFRFRLRLLGFPFLPFPSSRLPLSAVLSCALRFPSLRFLRSVPLC